jgi:hypothetical protein
MGNKYDIFISYRCDNSIDKAQIMNQYLCAVGHMVFLCSSLGAPSVLLCSPYGDSEDARYINGGPTEQSWRCDGGVCFWQPRFICQQNKHRHFMNLCSRIDELLPVFEGIPSLIRVSDDSKNNNEKKDTKNRTYYVKLIHFLSL